MIGYAMSLNMNETLLKLNLKSLFSSLSNLTTDKTGNGKNNNTTFDLTQHQ
jgi:hypothetical protein